MPSRPTQLLLVTTTAWKSVRGEAQRYEAAPRGGWRKVGVPMPVLLGRNGLAWGLGQHTIPAGAVRVKREGDGCAPAGVFAIGNAFGFAPAAEMRGLRVPYFQVTPQHEAIDDPRSRQYNRIVEGRDFRRTDWTSSEKMHAIPGYTLGLVVHHNPRRVPGAGSCIFLHAWLGERGGSAGCTLLRPADLRTVIDWLDSRCAPVLVQVPHSELPRLGFAL